MTFGYFLKTKDEVKIIFQEFKAMVENQTGHSIKVLRTDNGTEYVNREMDVLLRTSGIRHQNTVPHTPEQNGVAERANRTIMEKSRCMIQDSKLGVKFWEEAVNTAIYFKNRSPTKAVMGETPLEAWTGRKINLELLKVFGCREFVHVPNHDRKKLEPKSKAYIFVGYCSETKGYRLGDCENSGRVIKARDVIFLEDQPRNGEVPRPERTIEQSSGSGVIIPAHTVEVIRQEIQPQQESEGECSSQGEQTDEDLSDNQNSEDSTRVGILEDLQPHQTRRYPKRERKPKEFPDTVLYQAVCVPSEEPTSVEEALSTPEREQWKQAMDEEYRSLQINEAWELVTLPKGKKAVKSK
jgi:hypothetical protein